MKQKEVFKKIGGIIQELSEQYDYLQTTVDNLNDLELELFVANAHFLTDHIEILCKLNLQNRPRRPLMEKPEPANYQQKFFEPVVQQMKPGPGVKDIKAVKTTPKLIEVAPVNKEPEPEKQEEETVEQPVEVVVEVPAEKPAKKEKQPEPEEQASTPVFDFTSQAPEDSYSFIREEPETIRHELILDEADTWDEEVEPLVEELKTEDEKVEEIETPPIAEEAVEEPIAEVVTNGPEEVPVAEIEEEKPEEAPIVELAVEKLDDKVPAKDEDEVITRNQKISAQMGDKAVSKTDQASIKPISDIKLAITLNDKLMYVKDLFNGYNLAYSEAIEILNRFNTFEEAQRFLKTNYVTKNNWEGKAATTEKFYALLRRRYA
ncbi:hypothetical protein [Mucilaginibacter sp.]|uniref:hypothetical protein n=1 Tax=Mucilaginibacter sp. TaxID=1882438 RepID=UPI0025D79AAB|nr:hypothetical protein [Mucilaginibacter sp.]